MGIFDRDRDRDRSRDRSRDRDKDQDWYRRLHEFYQQSAQDEQARLRQQNEMDAVFWYDMYTSDSTRVWIDWSESVYKESSSPNRCEICNPPIKCNPAGKELYYWLNEYGDGALPEQQIRFLERLYRESYQES